MSYPNHTRDDADDQFRQQLLALVRTADGADVRGAYVVPGTDSKPQFQVEITAVDASG
jgi:hypothetical protein